MHGAASLSRRDFIRSAAALGLFGLAPFPHRSSDVDADEFDYIPASAPPLRPFDILQW